MVRRVPSKQRTTIVCHQQDHKTLQRLGLLLASGLLLSCGFVYAGGQHFAALRLGYQTERLRTVRDELTEEQHRLLLEREAAASPLRLELAARRLGMQPLQAAQIDPLTPTANQVPAPALRAIEGHPKADTKSVPRHSQPRLNASAPR